MALDPSGGVMDCPFRRPATSFPKIYSYIHLVMATTRLFRNGNSQAVRIPAELAYARSDLELEIERCGEELRIRPAGRPISGALEALAAFSPSFLAGGREPQEQREREAL